MNKTEKEQKEQEEKAIIDEIAASFGLPVSKGEVVALEDSFGVEFGDVVVSITCPPSTPRAAVASFAYSIASFPEIFAHFGIDTVDAVEDFNQLLLVLKNVVSLFAKRAGANEADINIAVSDSSGDTSSQ